MDYGFYLAEIVDIAVQKDSRLTVRVLPYMKDIPDTECPTWSSFFRDSLYTGKVGDLVWVVCDNEFSVGYVFGLANYTTYSEVSSSTDFEKSSDGVSLSIPTTLTDAVTTALLEVNTELLDLSNAKVTYWDDNSIHYIERESGGEVIAFKNGTLYIFRKNEFVVKIGSNVIKINSDSISMNGAKILMQSEYIGLGNGKCGGKVLVTNGVSADGAYPSEAVHA